VGKTHLAVAIARSLLSAFREDLLFVDFASIAGIGSQGQENEWDRLKRVSLLIVDDFGVAPATRELARRTAELFGTRREFKRGTIFTGDRVSCRQLFRGSTGKCSSPTQLFLASFHPSLLVEFFGNIKVLAIDGEGNREHAPQKHRRLF
jgi:hypothetical protein